MISAFLCADIGTSSLKTALIGTDGRVLAVKRQYFQGIYHRYTEVCARAQVWCDAFYTAAYSLRGAFDGEILGICISGNGPTLVSEDGSLLLWNTPAPDNVPAAVGTSLFIPRLLFFRTVYPKLWEDSRYIYSGPEYLIWTLTGTPLTILPEKRYTEAYWTAQSLEQNDIAADKLPAFVPPGYCAGVLLPSAAERCGLNRVPVYCGAPDFITALVGTDTLAPGKLCDRAGTSEGLNLCTCHPAHEKGIRTLPAVLPDMYNASVLIADSGRRFSDYKKNNAPSLSYTDLVINLIKTGSGEGFDLISQIAREVGDGVAHLRRIARNQNLSEIQSMRITGGQGKNSAWVQFKSSAANIAIEVPECADSELIGDAVFAGVGSGLFSSVSEGAAALVRIAHVYEPRRMP